MTTTVLFTFVAPDGKPIADTEFVVTLRKAAFHEDNPGLIYPDTVNGVTDANGLCSLELQPANKPYYLSMDLSGTEFESECGAALRFRFMVPVSAVPLPIRDLIVTDPTWSQPWDELALQTIIDAKVASQAAAAAAAVSEDNAANSEAAAQASEAAAADSAASALTSKNAAKASQDAALVSQNAAKASETAAKASETAAKTSETNAKTSETNAKSSETAAATSAAAALASEGKAKTSETNAKASETAAAGSATAAAGSAAAALVSQNAAKTSETNAKTSETNAKSSADAAAASAANMQPLSPKLTAIAAAVWSANQMLYLTGAESVAVTGLTAAGRALLDDADAAAQRTTLGLDTSATLAATVAQAHDAAQNLPDTSVTRVSEAVYASRKNFGFYSGSTPTYNIDTLPAGWCGLLSTAVAGTKPPLTGSFFWLESQATYTGQSAVQIAYQYAGGATSGTLLEPRMAMRVRNQPGNAWSPWGLVLTSYDKVSDSADATADKLLTVGYRGLGALVSPTLLDLSAPADFVNGFGWTTSGTLNVPVGYASGSNVLSLSSSAAEGFQMIFSRNTSGRFAVRRRISNSWGAWVEPVLPGDFGLGTANPNLAAGTQLDSLNTSCLFQASDATPPDWSGPVSGNYPMGISFYRSSIVRAQLALSYGNAANAGAFRRATTGSGWGAWSKLLERSDLVGTVSGTSAAPTGAVIERGNNANGHYVKYADGTMICWRRATDTGLAISTAMRGAFRSDIVAWTFPVAFIEAPMVVGAAKNGTASSVVTTTGANASVSYYYVHPTNDAALDRSADFIAIGRWV